VPLVEECPHCKGRRLTATRKKREHAVGGVRYTGFVKIVFCKTCRAVFTDKAEEEAFILAVELVASKATAEGEAPRMICRKR
jgi:Zn-finger nucleic acid-binding protein